MLGMQRLKASSRRFSDNFRRTHSKTLKNMENEEYSQNQFWSPFSVLSAIGTLWLGSKSDTKSQIHTVVFSWSPKEEEVHQGLLDLTKEISKPYKNGNDSISVANRMFIQNDFELVQKFIDDNKKFYSSEVGSTDFGKSEEARTTINSWVEKKTNDKIQDLLPEGSLTSDTKLVLVNAIHFLGTWKYQFNSSLTKSREFHIHKYGSNATTTKATGTKKETVKVDMMSAERNFTFCRLDGIAAEMLKLNYTDDRLSMLIVLPDKKDGLEEVLKNFREFNQRTQRTSNSSDRCSNKQRVLPAIISIPKFKIEAEYKMKDVLTEMGMKDVFDGKKADLSGISKKNQLYVNEIYHKAFLNVDEKGTEAAASTGVVIELESAPKTFTCDHPFGFMIVENKFGSVLFEGLVADPTIGVEAKTE